MMEWLVALLLVAPAFLLYLARSTWLMDYLIWVLALNRGIRRIVDWKAGAFNPLSPISLTPLVIAGLLFLVVLWNYRGFPAYFQRVARFFAGALLLAFIVGFARNQLAAVYTLAEAIAPLAIMAFAVLHSSQEPVLDRWVKSVGWAAVVVSLYGWYQFYTIPPWDAFWVRAVGFEGYLGALRPTEMTVFSTMGERGPLAGFLAFAVIPMLVSRRWRNLGGWVSVLLILSAILLTYVRSAVVTVALAAVLFPILNHGRNTVRIVVITCAIALVGMLGLKQIPSSDKIGKRLESLASITEDGSFQGRMEIIDYGLAAVLTNPFGTGLGSTGLAGRVHTGGLEAGAAIGDNGYLSILYTYGWVGAGLFFFGFWLIWKQVRLFERYGIRTEAMMMFKTLFFTGAVALIVGDWISSPGAVIFFLFAGYAISPRRELELRWRAQQPRRAGA